MRNVARGDHSPAESTSRWMLGFTMGRTNVVVNDELVDQVKSMYGLRTTREAIDFALRTVAGVRKRNQGMLELEGVGWDADLGEMRDHAVAVRRAAVPAGRLT
jgi:Arc/MetJ family transcription regulator